MDRITPACAGSTFCNSSKTDDRWDHPRLRGEYIQAAALSRREKGSPPLARGVHQDAVDYFNKHGITPACAGSTARFLLFIYFKQDHPRLRGEYFAM